MSLTPDEEAGRSILAGNLLGILMTMNGSLTQTAVEPLLDSEGNYTNQIVVRRSSGDYLVTVEHMKEIQ